MRKATFDPAINLDLYFRKGRNGEKEFRFFNEDETEHELIDEFEIICDFPISLEVESNILRLLVDQEDTRDVRNSYFYDIVNITKGKSWFVGNANFSDTTASEVEDITNVTIILEGEPVTVTIREPGGDFSGDVNGGTP